MANNFFKHYVESCKRFAVDSSEWGYLENHHFYTTDGYGGWVDSTDGEPYAGVDVSWAFHLTESDIEEDAAWRFTSLLFGAIQADVVNECDCDVFQTTLDEFWSAIEPNCWKQL